MTEKKTDSMDRQYRQFLSDRGKEAFALDDAVVLEIAKQMVISRIDPCGDTAMPRRLVERAECLATHYIDCLNTELNPIK